MAPWGSSQPPTSTSLVFIWHVKEDGGWVGGEDTIPLNLIPVTVGVSPNNCILNNIYSIKLVHKSYLCGYYAWYLLTIPAIGQTYTHQPEQLTFIDEQAAVFFSIGLQMFSVAKVTQ